MAEAEIDRLPDDVLAHALRFRINPSKIWRSGFCEICDFDDLGCEKWKRGVEESTGRRWSLSFAEWKMDDVSTARIVGLAYSLRELTCIKPFSPLLIAESD
ncbi:unnamed protein product [Rhodiola kirilowii]